MIFGERLGQPFENSSKPIVFISDSTPVDLDILNQLGFRLSNLEQQVYVIIYHTGGLTKAFYKKDHKFMVDGLEQKEKIERLIGRFPKINFILRPETFRTSNISQHIRRSAQFDTPPHLVFLNLFPEPIFMSKIYKQNYLEDYKSAEQSRTYFIQWGLNSETEPTVGFRFNQINGLLTPENESLRTINNLEQSHAIRFMVSMMVNDLIGNERITYSELRLSDFDIKQRALRIPSLTVTQRLGIMTDTDLTRRINESTDQFSVQDTFNESKVDATFRSIASLYQDLQEMNYTIPDGLMDYTIQIQNRLDSITDYGALLQYTLWLTSNIQESMTREYLQNETEY